MPQPPERDLQQTGKRLTQWLAGRMPGATGLRVEGLRGPENTGFSSDTLMFDLRYSAEKGSGESGLEESGPGERGSAEKGSGENRPGEETVAKGRRAQGGRRGRVEHCRELVVRLAPTGFPVFPEYDIGKQFQVQKALAGTAVPVPRVYWLEEDPTLLESPFYLMERVAGQVPPDSPPYHMEGWVTEIAPAQRAELWWSWVETLAQIHSLDPDRLGLSCLDRPELGKRLLDQELNYYESYLAWAMEGEPHPYCDPVLAWLKANKPPAGEDVRALCWGDARIGNVLFQDFQAAAVLDWEMACLGNPLMDLAWGIFLDAHHSRWLDVEPLEGFPSPHESICRWEALTGYSGKHFRYYELMAALRFGVIMVRLGKQMEYYELLPAGSNYHIENTVTKPLQHLLEAIQAAPG